MLFKNSKNKLIKYIIFISIGFLLFSIFLFKPLYKDKKKLNYYSNSITSIKEISSEKSKKNFSNFKDLNMPKENVSINFEGKSLNLKLPIYNDYNRLYIPLSEILYNLKGSCNTNNNIIAVSLNNINVNISIFDNSYILKGEKYFLKKNLIISDEIVYISLFDFYKIFNLKIDWNLRDKCLNLFYNRDKLLKREKTIITNQNRIALIRLEDITAGQRYSTDDSLERLRIIAQFLDSESIPFHVAWVPRYVEPLNKIDNDLSKDFNLYNADFIFTLDYFLDKNGIIGLHGYTHQHDNENSIDGTEFNGAINATPELTHNRAIMSINTANKLQIPFSFFESPHYASTLQQKKILGEHFNYIYDGWKSWRDNEITTIKIGDKSVKFVPTPLNYVNGKFDTNNMINKIKKLPQNSLGSFFYHPNIEFEYINIIKDETGYPYYSYSENSVLHRLIKVFKENNFEFKAIHELN